MDAVSLISVLFRVAIVQNTGWAAPGPNHLTIFPASVISGHPEGLWAAMVAGDVVQAFL